MMSFITEITESWPWCAAFGDPKVKERAASASVLGFCSGYEHVDHHPCVHRQGSGGDSVQTIPTGRWTVLNIQIRVLLIFYH